MPSSDPVRPSLFPIFNPGEMRRSLRSDDASSLKISRGGSYINMVANSSFEFDQPFSGWRLLNGPGGGNVARYCSGSVDQACFLQFNGNGSAGASIYQDMADFIGPGPENSPPWHVNQTWSPSVMAAAPGGSGRITVAVFFLNTGGGLSRACNITATSSRCSAPSFRQPAGNTLIRLQVYNEITGNVNIDDLRLSRG